MREEHLGISSCVSVYGPDLHCYYVGVAKEDSFSKREYYIYGFTALEGKNTKFVFPTYKEHNVHINRYYIINLIPIDAEKSDIDIFECVQTSKVNCLYYGEYNSALFKAANGNAILKISDNQYQIGEMYSVLFEEVKFENGNPCKPEYFSEEPENRRTESSDNSQNI